MKRRNFIRVISKVFAASVFLSAFTVAFADDMSSDLKEKKQELEEKMSEISAKKSQLDKQVKDVKARKNQKIGQKKNLDKQVAQKKEEITSLNKKITMLNSDISKATNEILNQEKAIEESRETLKSRIKNGYMAPSVTKIEYFMEQGNFSKSITAVEYTARIADHDKMIIDDLNEELSKIEARKKELEDNEREVELSKAKIEKLKQELDKQIAEIGEEVHSMEKEEAAYLKDSAVLKKQMDELQAEIARICRESGEDSPYVGGDLAWPVPGYYSISSPYGPRSFDGFHTGTDIAGRGIYGKNVVAANDGKVTFVNTSGRGPYGNYVIISHGGGISTLYAHLSSFNCSFGQNVSKGQTIGLIGSTGFSTGPHLHFEVRVNGKHTNPMSYFKKK